MSKWYTKYINTSLWKSKRQQRLKLDGHACRLCDEDGTNYRLEVHHRPSSYAKIPYESAEDDLITLCSFCHQLITSHVRERRYQADNIQINHIKERILYYGLEDSEVPIKVGLPLNAPQRRIGESAQSDCPADQKNLWQAIKDGGRP